MPQLDHIIIFTQVFWLLLTFIVIYILLTYFFLPTFLKSLKSRSSIIESNLAENVNMQTKFASNQILIDQLLIQGLSNIKVILTIEFLLNNDKNSEQYKLHFIDKQMTNAIFNTMLYCDSQVLEYIPLIPKIYRSTHYTK
uniref:ATP synthase F0 subunit 8 n=1 Tax=Balbiania investiens TaxID=111861 RepID=A0A4D6BLB9_9FLOR